MQTTADWYADKEIAFTFFSRVYGRHQPLTNAQPEKDYGTACSTTRATTPIFAFGWDRRGEHHSWCTDCDGRGDDRRWSTPNSIIVAQNSLTKIRGNSTRSTPPARRKLTTDENFTHAKTKKKLQN